MKRTPPVKLPIDPAHQCQLLLPNGKKCDRLEFAVMTRRDGSTQRLCRLHSVGIREQINKYPDRFTQVRFSLIVK